VEARWLSHPDLMVEIEAVALLYPTADIRYDPNFI
jgi:hypothetical protein